MTSTYFRRPSLALAARLAGRLAAVLRECNTAQRRMTAISTAPDWYTAHPDAARHPG